MNESISAEELGKRLKNARERANMTQKRLSELSGITTTQLSAYENGKKNIGLYSLSRLAIVLKTTMDELYLGSPSERPIARSTNVGELIVNCVDALRSEGVITYLPRERRSDDYNDYVLDGLYYKITIYKYAGILDDLVRQLTEFDEKKEKYPEVGYFCLFIYLLIYLF